MKVWLMQPASILDAEELVRTAWFTAKRCRTDKNHDALYHEVWSADMSIVGRKLWAAVKEDWALDLIRHTCFTFDFEGFPQWFWAEIGRHKFIKENMEIEQRSERALPGYRIEVLNPFGRINESDRQWFDYLVNEVHEFQSKMLKYGYTKDEIRNASFQGTLTPRVMSMNAETIHHLIRMRGSKELVQELGGRAAPLFQEMVGEMWELVQERCPWLFVEVLVR